MNEVTKLYENAGVNVISQKTKDCNCCYYYEEAYDAPCHVCTTDKCPFEKNIIPQFTAEKQLEIVKLIANSKGYPDYEYFGKLFDDYIQLLEFDEALAKLVNHLWQDLTEEEKQQVKGILE